MSKSTTLISLSLYRLNIKEKGWKYLSKGIGLNKTLRIVKIRKTIIPLSQFANLAHSLQEAESIEIIDLSDDCIKDSYGLFIRKIISSHSERRDEIVWAYSLRDEKPPGILFRNGLHTDRKSVV